MRMAAKLTVAVAGLVLVLGGPAWADFVAYNDCCYSSTVGPQYIGTNVTTYNIGNNSPGPATGLLKDKTSGINTAVTVTLAQNGGVIYQPDFTTGGTDCNSGTDAYTTFGTICDMHGTIYYGSTGWWVDITFTGLDSTKTYELVTSANRNGGTTASYTNRWTKYTISSADAFTNASSVGTVASNGGATVSFCTGMNTTLGYQARWTGITSGTDNTFKVRAEADTTYGATNSYSFDVFKLVETPEPATLSLLALGGLAALRRRMR